MLHRNGKVIEVRENGEPKLKVPIHLLSGIVCFGVVTVTPPCMQLCVKNGVLISFLAESGKFLARVVGPVSGNVLLRKAQYKTSEDIKIASLIARRVVTAKICNCRTVLHRSCRDHPEAEGADKTKEASQALTNIINQLKNPEDLDTIRGREGDGAKRYFAVFQHLIVAQKDQFRFTHRNRRPPLDPVNALLSFLYTLLVHDISSSSEAVGLDPAVGFLHRDRPGRPGLALDILEEMRAPLADRLALSLINRKQIKPEDFSRSESGAVLLNETGRKKVLSAWQERKRETLLHPFIEEKVEIGQVPFVQCLLLARYLRGDLDDYPAFIWK